MSWRNRWPEREPRPKVKRLSKLEKQQILAVLCDGIEASPVLSALDIRARTLRGRFYFERLWQDEHEEEIEIEVIGRATPLDGFEDILLLEVEKRKGNWYYVTEGTPVEIINTITSDSKGTFHGLGALDASLRRLTTLREVASGLNRQEMTMLDEFHFVYTETQRPATAQEALFHFFGVPIKVIAEPRQWYVYHRRPEIIEVNQDHTAILVTFTAESLGGSFGGVCLYAMKENQWHACTIKPNQSQSIATSLAWLEKRKWRAW